jgi:hypothetical protein
VSKLCCPVCWELLKVLRGKERKYLVRGHHDCLYDVDFPDWLENDVAKDMVSPFRRALSIEIATALNVSSEKRRRMSNESIMSVSSVREAEAINAMTPPTMETSLPADFWDDV